MNTLRIKFQECFSINDFSRTVKPCFSVSYFEEKGLCQNIEGLQYSKMQQFLPLTSVNSIKSLKICNYLEQLANVLCQVFNS